MTLTRTEVAHGTFSIKGKVSGEINDYIGGNGEARFKLKGKIKNNVIKMNLKGQAEMTQGPTSITGKMEGNITDTKGSGTFRVQHIGGASTGEYTIRRI